MDAKEIEAGNRLIMESPFAADHHKRWIEKLIKFEGNPDTAYENAKYHTSWDWLMPVVRKIIWLPMIKGVVIRQTNLKEEVVEGLMKVDKETIFKAAVQFITWYNQQSASPDKSNI